MSETRNTSTDRAGSGSRTIAPTPGPMALPDDRISPSAHVMTLLCILVLLALPLACFTPIGIELDGVDPLRPRLFYVGTEPVIVFDGKADVEVPVVGFLLDKTTPRITAEGTVAPRSDEIDVKEIDGWSAKVIIKKEYFERTEDKDILILTVTATETDDVDAPAVKASKGSRTQPISITRHFTLRRVQEYRSGYLETLAPYTDVKAFPISSRVVEQIFGEDIDENYYVIAVRVYNRSGADKVITAGMITANGRLVALGPGVFEAPILVMPVQISPVQTTLAYTNVDARSEYTVRNITFRSLSFVGALATGAAEAFTFNASWKSAISLFTGIAIPEGQKLWPDPSSEHLANIVTFGMPDTVKVAAGSSAGGVLFFAKRELHSMVGQSEYLKFVEPAVLSSDRSISVEHPPQFIAGLEVNALNVFFENTISPEDLDRLRRRGELLADPVESAASTSIQAHTDALAAIWGEGVEDALKRVIDVAAQVSELAAKEPDQSLRDLAADSYPLHPAGARIGTLKASYEAINEKKQRLQTRYDQVETAVHQLEQRLGAFIAAKNDGRETAKAALLRASADADDRIGALRTDSKDLAADLQGAQALINDLHSSKAQIIEALKPLLRDQAGVDEMIRLLGTLSAS